MPSKHLGQKVFLVLSVLSFLGFLFVFIALPTRSIQTLLMARHLSTEHYEKLGLFFSLFLTLIFWMVSRLFAHAPSPGRVPERKMPRQTSPWMTVLQIAVSLYLFGRAVHQVFEGPLDTDETYISLGFTEGSPWSVINPFLTTRNHGLSTLLSYVSCELFGYSEMATRYPAIPFALLFLILLFFFCRRFTSPVTMCLIYGNLAMNQLALWYMHSMRGYIPMMFFSLVVLTVIFSAIGDETPKRPQMSFFALALSLIALTLTHSFGGFFCAVTAFGLLSWLVLVDGSNALLRRYFWTCASVVPLVAMLSFFQANAIKSEGLFDVGHFPDLRFEFVRFFGIPFGLLDRACLLLVVVLAAAHLNSRASDPKNPLPFVSRLLVMACLFIGGIAWGLQVVRLEARMVLAFFIPVLFWVGESISNLEDRRLRQGTAMVAVCLFVMCPAAGKPELYQVYPEILVGYKQFIRHVRNATAPVEKNCYEVSGAPWEVRWTKGLYLIQANSKYAHPKDCVARYHVFFETGFDNSQTLSPPKEGYYVELYNDGKGRHLYQHVVANLHLVSSSQ